MWYARFMARRQNPWLDWERLLDGATYTLDLDAIGWQGSLNDLRAKVHYEADRRKGIAHTTKINHRKLRFYGEGTYVLVNPSPCTCQAPPQGPHTLGCRKFQTMPTPLLPESHPDFVATPDPVMTPAAPKGQQPAPTPVEPQPEGQAPTTTVDRYAPDLEHSPSARASEDNELTPDENFDQLLGPCTCGQAPRCLPSCARAGGQAA